MKHIKYMIQHRKVYIVDHPRTCEIQKHHEALKMANFFQKRKKTEKALDYNYSTRVKVIHYLKENAYMATKTELMYLGQRRLQINVNTLTAILEDLEQEKHIQINRLPAGKRTFYTIRLTSDPQEPDKQIPYI